VIEPRPRLLHITTTDMSLALLLGNQLRAFAAAGYEVIGASAPGPYVPQLQDWGIEHVPIRHSVRSVAPVHDVAAFAETHRVVRRLRPTIVHTHNPKPGISGRLAGRLARSPIVVNTVHGLYATETDAWRRRAAVYGLERIAASCSDAELVQNREDLETLARVGIPRRKLHLLGNGVDLARFDPTGVDAERVHAVRHELGAAPGDMIVGMVGRLVAEKGYREVFAAASGLRVRHPNALLVVVGPADPDKRDALTPAEIEDAELGGVRFLGSRDDMEHLYAAMDLYVLASHREGFPRSAMEAAAMGVPVIATDIRGCREVVDHGVNGLLVAPRDAQAVADAISSLVSDAERRAAMSTAGRAKAERDFDERRVVDRTLEVYDTLLHARGRRA
jgi:glycosyltransferase involved in cell wall biosynthesis